MTCNVEYYREFDDPEIKKIVVVNNFYGKQSFKVSDSENDKRWDQMGTMADAEMEWFKEDENNLIENNYLNEYARKTGSF